MYAIKKPPRAPRAAQTRLALPTRRRRRGQEVHTTTNVVVVVGRFERENNTYKKRFFYSTAVIGLIIDYIYIIFILHNRRVLDDLSRVVRWPCGKTPKQTRLRYRYPFPRGGGAPSPPAIRRILYGKIRATSVVCSGGEGRVSYRLSLSRC